MNIYVIRIAKSGLTGVKVEVDSSCGEKPRSHPFCECISLDNAPFILGTSIAVVDDQKASSNTSVAWKTLTPEENGTLPMSTNTIEASQAKASDVLLHLSDTLPLPGSYTLHVLFDLRGRDILDSPISTAVAGALMKLCQWHRGRLKVYTDCELPNHELSLFHCIDSHFHVHPCGYDGEAVYTIPKREFWSGALTLYGDNMEQHDLKGLAMFMPSATDNEAVVINTVCDSKAVESAAASHIWVSPKIRIASLIDVSTLPATYYTGRKFELRYTKDGRYLEQYVAVESIFDSLTSKSTLAYLCHLHYAISDVSFSSSAKLSSTWWRQSVMEESVDDASKLAVPCNVSNLYFLLGLPQKDKDVIKFSCVILNQRVELDWKIPRQVALLLQSANDDIDAASDLPSCSETLVNIFPLVRRYLQFKLHTSKALTEWLDNHLTATAISGNELQTVVDKSLRHISAEITKSWKRCADVIGPLSFHVENDNLISIFIYETQKAMLLRFQNAGNVNAENLSESATTKSASTLDMHLAPNDVLAHFLLTGECRDGYSILKQNLENQEFLSKSLLANFEESRRLSYHGVSYNVDELKSENDDRACRRLLEKCVKFETRSIGSIDKVPSYCIMAVGDSPKKNSHFNKTHLKKVAEKLHKKRILKRKSDSQPVAHEGTSMTLRSTPKKSLQNISQNGKIAPKEQRRSQRRTYVQDNKKRLEKLVANSLIDNGVPLNSKRFESCSRRLYNVCMAFLRELKTSKNLDKIMRETVDKNVCTVISFDA